MVTKGRNRDTDWFSVTDAEWPAVRAAHERWLDPANFDERRSSAHETPRPSSRALIIACARSGMPSLVSTLETWLRTVLG